MNNKQFNETKDCIIDTSLNGSPNQVVFTIAANAMDELRNVIKFNNIPASYYLRLRIDGGGCNGVSFRMHFEDHVDSDDKTFNADEIKIVIDSKSLSSLMGITLDFVESDTGKGFLFKGITNCPTCGMPVERN